MKIPIFKRNLVHTLFQNVDRNLEHYQNGTLSEVLEAPEYKDNIRELRDFSFEPNNLMALKSDLSTGRDVENAILVHQELGHLPAAIATDERIWTAICHLHCPDFVWDRWVARRGDDEDAQENEIKRHYFAKIGGRRGVLRNNALSSLWWIAHVATKNRPDVSAEQAIREFAELSDVRSAILERPSISRIPAVFGAIMSCYNEKMNVDPETSFFRRTRTGGQYLDWLKKINNLGGMTYFAAMDETELRSIFWSLLEDCENA